MALEAVGWRRATGQGQAGEGGSCCGAAVLHSSLPSSEDGTDVTRHPCLAPSQDGHGRPA
jgi:hypothetical protein